MLERALKDAVSNTLSCSLFVANTYLNTALVSLSRMTQHRLCLKYLTLCREYLNTTYVAHT